MTCPNVDPRGHLKAVDPSLANVIVRAGQIAWERWKLAFIVIEGLRSTEQCHINWGKGRTAAECVAVGVAAKHAQPKLRKVTWTLNSKHKKQANGFSAAADVLPAPYDWKIDDPKSTPEVDDAFAKVNLAMMQAARELGVGIRWGANWNGDTKIREKGEGDNPHFELKR